MHIRKDVVVVVIAGDDKGKRGRVLRVLRDENKLVVEGSIEERMLALQSRKRTLAEGVLGHDDESAAKFSEQDLADLLAPLR